MDLRSDIQNALAGFTSRPIKEAAKELLRTLGYTSDRTLDFDSVDAFCDQFDPEGKLNHPSALKADWKSVDIVFQLTDEELSRTSSLFKETGIQQGLMKSYLFFAIELTGDHYARGKLTALARQLNRLFPMPVMVLIKHGGSDNRVGVSSGKRDNLMNRDRIVSATLSIAVINRRRNKQDAAKDVLGKVTIIRDISLADPHRGHLDILDSFGCGFRTWVTKKVQDMGNRLGHKGGCHGKKRR